MGRKATEVKPLPAPPVLNEAKFEEATRATNELATHMKAVDVARDDAKNDEILAVGIDLGRLESMDFLATVATSAMVSIYENVKKSKAWRILKNFKSGDGRHFSSLEEFCEVKLGRSHRRLREISLNRSLIGQEAFEQAERMGLRQVDYNAIKLLPQSDQALVQQAVQEASTKDEVLAVLHDLVARHVQQKTALEKRATEAEADKAATETLFKQKNKKIDDLKRQVSKFSFTEDWPEQVNAAATMVDQVSKSIEVSLDIVIQTCQQALAAMPPDEAQREHHERGMAVLAARVRDAMARQALVQRRVDEHFAATLGHFLAD